MAKDDYEMIIAKILVYLYAKMKGRNETPAYEYIHPMSKDFPVSEEYLNAVIDDMADHGYVKLKTIRAWGGDIVYRDLNKMVITLEGVQFLKNNSAMRKIVNTIPMAASIFELFQ